MDLKICDVPSCIALAIVLPFTCSMFGYLLSLVEFRLIQSLLNDGDLLN